MPGSFWPVFPNPMWQFRTVDRNAIDKKIVALRDELRQTCPPELATQLKSYTAWALSSRCLEADAWPSYDLVQAINRTADAEFRLKTSVTHPLTELDILLARVCTPGL